MGGPSVTSPNIITPLILPVLSCMSWWWQWWSCMRNLRNYILVSVVEIAYILFRNQFAISKTTQILNTGKTEYCMRHFIQNIKICREKQIQSTLTSSQSILIYIFTDEVDCQEYLHRMKRFHSNLAKLSNWTGLIDFLNITFMMHTS